MTGGFSQKGAVTREIAPFDNVMQIVIFCLLKQSHMASNKIYFCNQYKVLQSKSVDSTNILHANEKRGKEPQ